MGKGGKRQAWPTDHVDVGAVEIGGRITWYKNSN